MIPEFFWAARVKPPYPADRSLTCRGAECELPLLETWFKQFIVNHIARALRGVGSGMFARTSALPSRSCPQRLWPLGKTVDPEAFLPALPVSDRDSTRRFPRRAFSAHPAPSIQPRSNGFALVMRLLPSPVGPCRSRIPKAPSVRPTWGRLRICVKYGH